MSQNRSLAVMAQRKEPKDSLDLFSTPPWATRALCEHIGRVEHLRVWEPACGYGDMVRPLKEYFAEVQASDVYPHGGFPLHDFLFPGEPLYKADWIITNPPFRLAAQFVDRALAIAHIGVATLVRLAFLEGQDRYETLFKPNPPTEILQFTERVTMLKGRLHDGNTSTATAYCWIVWRQRRLVMTRFGWIPPCRKRLERAEDYAEAA